MVLNIIALTMTHVLFCYQFVESFVELFLVESISHPNHESISHSGVKARPFVPRLDDPGQSLMPQLKGCKWAVKLGLLQDDSSIPCMFGLCGISRPGSFPSVVRVASVQGCQKLPGLEKMKR